jgi:hypothetical protein
VNRRQYRRWVRDVLTGKRQQHETNLRQRAVTDVDRARLHMVAAIVDARRVGAPVPVKVGRTMVTLTLWVQQLQAWARESEQ